MKNVEYLPDCYRKEEDSNNYRLLELNALAVKELKADIQAVMDSLDLKKANGKTLDLYGEMIEQWRGLLDDDQYRYMILARIGRNVAQGDYKSIMNALLLMFGGKQGDIALEDFEIEEEERSCAVKLSKFPVSILVSAGFSSRQAVQMIEYLLPVCVTLYASEFEGTFEFAEFENEYDESTGFADLSGKIGGYLGMLLGEDERIPVLPL